MDPSGNELRPSFREGRRTLWKTSSFQCWGNRCGEWAAWRECPKVVWRDAVRLRQIKPKVLSSFVRRDVVCCEKVRWCGRELTIGELILELSFDGWIQLNEGVIFRCERVGQKGEMRLGAGDKGRLVECMQELLFMNEKYDSFKKMQSKQNRVKKFEAFYEICLQKREIEEAGAMECSVKELSSADLNLDRSANLKEKSENPFFDKKCVQSETTKIISLINQLEKYKNLIEKYILKLKKNGCKKFYHLTCFDWFLNKQMIKTCLKKLSTTTRSFLTHWIFKMWQNKLKKIWPFIVKVNNSLRIKNIFESNKLFF